MVGIGQAGLDFEPIVDYVNQLRDRRIVLVGHGLGGGIAKLVAARKGHPSVALSPPGKLQHTTSMHDYVLDEVACHHDSISIIPERDRINKEDGESGPIHRIKCDSRSKSDCLFIEHNLCHLLTHCGDAEMRFSSCEYTEKDVRDLVWDHTGSGSFVLVFASAWLYFSVFRPVICVYT